MRDLPSGPVVKNLPSHVGDAGWIPGRGTKIRHAAEQLSLRALESVRHNLREKPARRSKRSRVPQIRPDTAK